MKMLKMFAIVVATLMPLVGFCKGGSTSITIGENTYEPDDGLFFSLEDAPETIKGYEVLGEYLPDGVEVTWTGKKFKMAAKAGKVKYSKSDEGFVTTNDQNPCGLKLSVSKKTGKVKGSFKIYVQKSEKKLKAYAAKVSGYVGSTLSVKIKGYGTVGASLQ